MRYNACRPGGRRKGQGGAQMLTLRSSGASPFARKVRIAAAMLGLDDRIAIEDADTGREDDSLRR